MTSFFQNVPPHAVEQIDALGRVLYDLREDRKQILAEYCVTDEAALLDQIKAAVVDEHPAYDHYLAAKTISETREAIREQLRELLATGV